MKRASRLFGLIALACLSSCKSGDVSTAGKEIAARELILTEAQMHDPTEDEPIVLAARTPSERRAEQDAWLGSHLPGAVRVKSAIRSLLDGEVVEWSPRVVCDGGRVMEAVLVRLPDGAHRVLYFDVTKSEPNQMPVPMSGLRPAMAHR